MPQHVTYPPAERPLCEVYQGWTWHPGEVRMWTQHDDGHWTANVTYSRSAGQNYIDTLDQTFIRGATPPC